MEFLTVMSFIFIVLFQNHIDFTNQDDINFMYINKKVYLLGYINIFFMKNVKVEAIGNATKLFTKRSYNSIDKSD